MDRPIFYNLSVNFEFQLAPLILEKLAALPGNGRLSPNLYPIEDRQEKLELVRSYVAHLLDSSRGGGVQPIGPISCRWLEPALVPDRWSIVTGLEPPFLGLPVADVAPEDFPIWVNYQGVVTRGPIEDSFRITLFGPKYRVGEHERAYRELHQIIKIMMDVPPNHEREEHRHGGWHRRPRGETLHRATLLSVRTRVGFDPAPAALPVTAQLQTLVDSYRDALRRAFVRPPGYYHDPNDNVAEIEPPARIIVEGDGVDFERLIVPIIETHVYAGFTLDTFNPEYVKLWFLFGKDLLEYAQAHALRGILPAPPPAGLTHILNLFERIDSTDSMYEWDQLYPGFLYTETQREMIRYANLQRNRR
ncbi:MAG: hypothetical protein M1823_004989 [Watsoniomyces obsoletus]|nr:MAG: hypothetical protein M1823_004989 [Watsoniomyces obsoletus]